MVTSKFVVDGEPHYNVQKRYGTLMAPLFEKFANHASLLVNIHSFCMYAWVSIFQSL